MADRSKTGKRQWRFKNGQQECQCSSCLNFWPATKEYFYFQGARGPHSWCKPCVASNQGRGPGMRTKLVEEPPSITYVAPAVYRGPLLQAIGLNPSAGVFAGADR